MELKKLTDTFAVAPQLRTADLPALRDLGYRALICARPDGEAAQQPAFADIERAARQLGIAAHYLPVERERITHQDVERFRTLLATLPRPLVAYCGSGSRASTLWALASAESMPVADIHAAGERAGIDLRGFERRVGRPAATAATAPSTRRHDVVIVGAGSAGIATAASLLAREPDLDVALVDPADVHYYQPGWTMVGAGIFDAQTTARDMHRVLPLKAHWIKGAVTSFDPDADTLALDDGRLVGYRQLVVCPGLKLDWDAIAGLPQTLGRNGVSSNYRYDLAPYTWQLVQQLGRGRALFTQPPMPIKCAGAPQKAMYLSCDHWRRSGRLGDIEVGFYNAGPALFGVADYVPALMEYVNRYGIALNFGCRLTAVDGDAKRAFFTRSLADGGSETFDEGFDMLHVVPPQSAPDFIRTSALADAAGWVDVDQHSLRHKRYSNVFGLGDATSTPNAKTVAAARAQAPVVAHNVLSALRAPRGRSPVARYDGYGACPLTVERGKIVLAEFSYGGKLAPTFPRWLIDGTRPSRLAWLLKKRILPAVYWHAMLEGREWFVKPAVQR